MSITKRDIQLYEKGILDDFDRVCQSNNIKYYVAQGSLIGAARHKGFIPWDDDIDVGMLRDDYNKFMELFNLSNTRYQFVCIENSPDFYLPYGKVCDTKTVLFEPDEQGYKLAVNIDVFVYDNAPDDDNIVERMFDRRDLLSKRFSIAHSQGKPTGNLLIRTIKYARRYIYRILYYSNTIKKMVDNSRLYENQVTERVGDFSAFERVVCHKRVFDAFIDVEFEGKLYKAPIGYDEWLKVFYGDYMELPPLEKRVTHHSYVAYIKENDAK